MSEPSSAWDDFPKAAFMAGIGGGNCSSQIRDALNLIDHLRAENRTLRDELARTEKVGP